MSVFVQFFICKVFYRKKNNRKAERGIEHIQADLFEHFTSHGHNGFLQDCTITLTDKTDGTDPTRRQDYWRRVLKTVSPYVLNTVAYKFNILARLLYIFPRQGDY